MSNVFLYSDSGPTGHGEVARQFVKYLLDQEDINLAWSTHDWGLTRNKGTVQGAPPFPDDELKEKLFNEGRINPEALVTSTEEFQNIQIKELRDRPSTMNEASPHSLLIKDFSGKEDVWIGLGGHGIPRQAPQDKDIYTIWETDYSLSRIPNDVHNAMMNVDEVWIPNEWNYEAFRLSGADMEKIRIVPYGVEHNDYKLAGSPSLAPDINDGKFNFVFVGRWVTVKGVGELLEAYFREFSGEENVRLFLKTMATPQIGITKEGIMGQAG